MEVRKSAEKDAEGLLEGLEAMRRAVIAEGCYPYRLVRVDMEAGRETFRGPACMTRMPPPRLFNHQKTLLFFLMFRALVLRRFIRVFNTFGCTSSVLPERKLVAFREVGAYKRRLSPRGFRGFYL